MSDEKCIEKFLELLENRVSITTGFTMNNEDGLLTHQYITISCGDEERISAPEPLEVPLMIAPAKEIGASLN